MRKKTNLKYQLVISISVICVLSPISAGQTIIYVDSCADPCGNGQSWAKAYQYLQDALTDANTTAKPVEIWVASGIYKPSVKVDGISDRHKAFQMINGVAIYGGFAGDEPNTFDVNNRDLTSNETILSGDLLGNDTPGLDPCDLLTDLSRSENCCHIFHHPIGTNLEPNAVIDGFTIKAGNADYADWPHYNGGGII